MEQEQEQVSSLVFVVLRGFKKEEKEEEIKEKICKEIKEENVQEEDVKGVRDGDGIEIEIMFRKEEREKAERIKEKLNGERCCRCLKD